MNTFIDIEGDWVTPLPKPILFVRVLDFAIHVYKLCLCMPLYKQTRTAGSIFALLVVFNTTIPLLDSNYASAKPTSVVTTHLGGSV